MIDYKLVDSRRWKEFLNSLDSGVSTVKFPTLEAIKSCKAIAYDMNSDKCGRTYTFKVDKASCSAEITVREDGSV